MNKQISLATKHGNDIYTISLPSNLINFYNYDFTLFMDRSTDLCKVLMKNGKIDEDGIKALRNSIAPAHKFIEQNIRGTFDKIVIDCWIEFICRQNEISAATLWNNYLPCRSSFERTIFRRLCEYRHNRAINQWVNILKIQEYARKKVDFIFGTKLKNPSEAIQRRNYFDLMFNICANESGYDIEKITPTKLYSAGSVPNSPFILSNVSKEIMRNVLTDASFSDNSLKVKSDEMADQNAMDAFNVMKGFINNGDDAIVGTIIRSMGSLPQKVYLPTGFKSVIDLEINALLESGAVIQRCGRCRKYYLRDNDYDYDYCDKVNKEGRTCLEIMNKEDEPKQILPPVDALELSAMCDELFKEMTKRINSGMSQRDFSDWYKYLLLIKDNVISGNATMTDFNNFAEYSRNITFEPEAPVKEPAPEPQKVITPEGEEKKVTPFVFKRIDRSETVNNPRPSSDTPTLSQLFPDGAPDLITQQARKATLSAAAVPAVQKQPPVQPTVSRIIRGNSALKVNSFDNPFDEAPVFHQGTVTIPVEQPKKEPAVQAVNIPKQQPFNPIEEDVKIYGELPSPVDLMEETDITEPEDNVKIYNIERLIPEEDIKVYRPKQQGRKRQREIPTDRLAESLKIPPKDVLHNPKELEDDNLTTEEKIKALKEITLDLPKAKPVVKAVDPKKAKAVSAYKSLDFNTEPPPMPTFDEIKEAAQRKDSISHTSAEFSNVLNGLEREDGFSQETEDEVVSHKTKHVLDAVFKPSHTNPMLNIPHEQDEQDK